MAATMAKKVHVEIEASDSEPDKNIEESSSSDGSVSYLVTQVNMI
jgi:hypothetical protein